MIFRLVKIVVLSSSLILAANIEAAQPSDGQSGALGSSSENTVANLLTLATHGDAIAQAILGQRYYTGEGVPKNLTKAFMWFQQAAEQGHAGAQIAVALMYARGHGVRKSSTRAIEWATKSAELGNARAQLVVGNMYDTGKGVRKDATKAYKWYQKAAAQGDADAQYNLGSMYYAGHGVRKDVVLAYAWFNLAGNRWPEPKRAHSHERDRVEQLMTPIEIAEAERLSFAWEKGQILTRERREPGISSAQFIQPVLLMDYELHER